MQIAVTTTFPLSYLDLCAKEMIVSFDRFWPKDIPIFIKLDKVSNEEYVKVDQWIKSVVSPEREYFLANENNEDQDKFLSETKDQGDNYRFHCARFSHKVYALSDTAVHIENSGLNYDYLIWLDADVVTKSIVTHDVLKSWLPQNTSVSLLQRKDAPHSECGFVGYNLKNFGNEIIMKMRLSYSEKRVFGLPGWTDCDVLDAILSSGAYSYTNLSENLPGWHVWPISPLGKYMDHRKGNRKVTESPKKQKDVQSKVDKVTALKDIEIKTRNCVEQDVIRAQVKENIFQIRNWVGFCATNDEEIVVCSAGPSLNREDILPFYKKGVKIVAVKHAMDRLLSWGIKPWACILLDPRPHVERFVKAPEKDVIYFVSTMVHPSVIKTLNENGCKVVGYHAHVGVDFNDILNPKEMLVSGGSATSTRCMGLLTQCLGFRTIHCFGYDLCHFKKPDPKELDDLGQQKYLEVTLSSPTWGGITVERTFWTEGQFLAQAKEIADLCKNDKEFKIHVYGDGIPGWQLRHERLYKEWADNYTNEMKLKQNRSLNVNEWINVIT